MVFTGEVYERRRTRNLILLDDVSQAQPSKSSLKNNKHNNM